ncbi:uncharacterized protein BDW47DRAFT_123955 [Aspergillus candidus]|uniref:ABC transporter family G domain-containing protein n=1 Tax=Aspergillus candidus TaxID=41067 RepID=A0A2I2FHA6_ASPCN|nr:hypothetical protein BDW47DRAFT_123955 [Aspergillus candidus]PLB40012.1 hypothetical protein BDW47DRAFT_123955 [Aspergillus candidus]
MGVISGEVLVDGKPRDESFQRKTGYAQQQDLHSSTSTVREAQTFSTLRTLLLFLDESTSGLDSQTSWAILDLLDKLKKNEQAILCTIHQPSAMLFQRFDRLLFLQTGGRTVYFGEVGENSHILIDQSVRNGGPPCPPDANPAEWMLDVIGAAPGSHTDIDWFDTWRNSIEYARVQEHLAELKRERSQQTDLSCVDSGQNHGDNASYREFAAPFSVQLCEVQLRVFQQIWRYPTHIYYKALLIL